MLEFVLLLGLSVNDSLFAQPDSVEMDQYCVYVCPEAIEYWSFDPGYCPNGGSVMQLMSLWDYYKLRVEEGLETEEVCNANRQDCMPPED
jgi:hypothetical protein